MKNPCTQILAPILPARIRAVAKLAAHDAAVSSHRAAYCGAAITAVCRVNAIVRTTSATDVFSGERCLGWSGVGPMSHRHLHGEALVSATPNGCA